MGISLLLKIILILLLIDVIIYVIKFYKSLKLSNRVNRYTVNNKDNYISIGDYIYNIYLNIKKSIIKFLKNSYYFKNKAKKYNKYAHDSQSDGFDIIANKILLSLLIGFIYLLQGIYKLDYNFFLNILIVLSSYFLYNIYLNVLQNKRNRLIENDLLRAVVIMNNAFKAGNNIYQAIDMVKKDLTGPISEEFETISNDLRYGLDLKDVFDRFYDRVKSDDIKYITSSLALLNSTGGNLVGVFSNIEKSFTNNKRLRDEFNSMTASSKLVYYVMLVMPIFLSLVLLLISPDYFKPLLNHFMGIVIIILIILLYLIYIFTIKKILRVDYE